VPDVSNHAHDLDRRTTHRRYPESLPDDVPAAERMPGQILVHHDNHAASIPIMIVEETPCSGMPITFRQSGVTLDASAGGSWFGGSRVAVVRYPSEFSP
jgi:hypothetical protein